MKTSKILSLAGLLPLLAASTFGATLIIGDNYDVANTGSGFNLDRGVNSGINPPTTRLTGSAASGLRYIKAAGNKLDSLHYITNSTKFGISRTNNESSTISLSTGTGLFDFAAALGSLAATPTEPAVYELTITMANASAGSQRCSFAISSTAGTANAWDFGVQIYHASGAGGYNVQKRIGTGIMGTGAQVNLPMTNDTIGVYPQEVSFLIRVTDAGAESTSSGVSRVQVSIDGGQSWIYDTTGDLDIPSGWRFPSSSRLIYWDIAPAAGPVTYDNFALNWISGPQGAARTWTGGGTDNNWSTGANWGGTAPVTGDSITFAGTSRQANNNDITGLALPWMTFSSGGFSLSGNALTLGGSITNASGVNTVGLDLSWNSGAGKTWSIASGAETVLQNISSVEVNGDHTLLGGGTLRVKGTMNLGVATTVTPAFIVNNGGLIVDGGTFSSRGGFRIGSLASAAAGAQTILTNGASMSLTVVGANLRVGDSANPIPSRLTMNNSSLTMAGGVLAVPYAAGATGVVSQTGGTVTGPILGFSDNGAGMGTYILKNGALEVLQIRKTTAAGSATIQFDNGTLRPTSGANSTNFFAGLNVAEILGGGLTLDATADVTVAQPLSGVGALTKIGGSTVTLSGANTYAGSTVVQAGKLVLPTTQTNSATIQVADGAELGVLATVPGSTLTASALTLGNGSGANLTFDFGSRGRPVNAAVRVNTLTASGPVKINLAPGLNLTTGRVVLIDYSGSIGGGFSSFSLGTLPDKVSATLVNNTANSSIDLEITGVPGYRWIGGDGLWNTTSLNWLDQSTGTTSTYADGYPTEFPDNASRKDVTLEISAFPASMTVSNVSGPYTFNAGLLTVPLVRKSGSGSAIRSGGEADNIGELQIDEGSFAYSFSYDSPFNGTLTDNTTNQGTFVKQGPGTMTAGSNPSFDGKILITDGVFKISTNNSLGTIAGVTTITNGGTLDVNNINSPHEPVIVSGTGFNGQGAIINSSTVGGVQNNLTDVLLAGDTTFSSASRWDLRVRSGTGPDVGLRGNGFNLTKIGSGTVSIASQRNIGANTPYWQMNLGNVLITEGTLTFAESLSLGNPDKTITVNPGAQLSFYDLGITNPMPRQILLTDASWLCAGDPAHTNVLTGPITLSGANHINLNQATAILNGSLAGSGSLGIYGTEPGVLLLNGVSTYSGDIYVTNCTVGGNGTLPGNLYMLGGTNSPGYGVGTLTVNGSVQLAGATRMELDRRLSPNSDRLNVGGSFSWSGDLIVVFAAGAPAPQAGDVYQLFNKAGTGSFSSIVLPDISAMPGSLAWDTTKLAINGTLRVTGAPTIGSASISGGNFVLSGVGGNEGSPYYVFTSTNVAAPLSTWTPVATNLFGPNGTFAYTNPVGSRPASFYRIKIP